MRNLRKCVGYCLTQLNLPNIIRVKHLITSRIHISCIDVYNEHQAASNQQYTLSHGFQSRLWVDNGYNKRWKHRGYRGQCIFGAYLVNTVVFDPECAVTALERNNVKHLDKFCDSYVSQLLLCHFDQEDNTRGPSRQGLWQIWENYANQKLTGHHNDLYNSVL